MSAPAPSPSPTSAPTPSSSSSSAAPHLAAGRLPLSTLREHARRELASLLDTPAGSQPKSDVRPTVTATVPPTGMRKALVLDKALSGPLGVIAEVDLLKRHGVDQIYHLELDRDLNTDCTHIIYLVRPQREQIQTIAQQILRWKQITPTPKAAVPVKRFFHIYFVPRRTMLAERLLIDSGIYGDVITGEYHLELIPFDDDVMSMEMKDGMRELVLDGDPTCLFYIARSLIKLQSLCGLIPHIKGKGPASRRVYDLMLRMRREQSITSSFPSTSPIADIDTLILIDRQVDMITPTLTQLTYEGLLDEVFGIKNSFIDVDPEVVGLPSDTTGKKKKLALNSNDSLFSEIRDLSFRVLGPLLHKKAEFIKDTYSERHQAVTVNEMHSFMQKFKTAHVEHTYLQTHINLAERISQITKSKIFDRQLEIERLLLEGSDSNTCEDYIEDRIAKREPLIKVLRLLILMTLTSGIRSKKYEFFKREIIQTYGYQHLITLSNLERIGLFSDTSRKSQWSTLRKSLRLHIPDIDLQNPQDIAYTYQGYAPMAVRLVEMAAQKGGWKRAEEVLNLLPGKSFEVDQDASIPSPTPATTSKSTIPASTPKAATVTADPPSTSKDKKPLTLVYFIGGVLQSEISALRHLSERSSHGRDYVVASSKLISGGTLLETLVEQIPNALNYKSLLEKK